MRVVMLGGAPGVGKSSVARYLLKLAQGGPDLLQWVDVDALWLHQPWRVDDRMTAMMRANLRAVAGHAAQAGVDILLITWVFQSAEMHRLVTSLLPPASTVVSVQLHAVHDTWCRRFEADPERPGLNDFYQGRYTAAQATPADHIVDTDGLTAVEVARQVAAVIGLPERTNARNAERRRPNQESVSLRRILATPRWPCHSGPLGRPVPAVADVGEKVKRPESWRSCPVP